MTVRSHIGLSATLCLLAAVGALGRDLKLEPVDVIAVTPVRERLRAHEEKLFSFCSLVPYGRSRYLAVLQKRVLRWNQWVDKKKLKEEAKEKGLITSYVPEKNRRAASGCYGSARENPGRREDERRANGVFHGSLQQATAHGC